MSEQQDLAAELVRRVAEGGGSRRLAAALLLLHLVEDDGDAGDVPESLFLSCRGQAPVE
jgi:hypothetical protein